VQLSLRIPGSMVVDPHIRSIAAATGMKVSENAIWFLVVAMREFTKTILKNCIGSKHAIECGDFQPVPMVRQRVLHRKRDIGDHKLDLTVRNNSEEDSSVCLSTVDLLLMTSSLSVGNARSIGGSVSRPTFERNLFASQVATYPGPGVGFKETKRLLLDNLCPPIDFTPRHEQRRQSPSASIESAPPPLRVSEALLTQPSPTPAQESQESKSPILGLGRGAKDLKSLKARSSVTKANVDQGGMPTVGQGSSSDPTTVADAAQSGAETPLNHPGQNADLAQAGAKDAAAASSPASTETGSPKVQGAVAVRKGLGFGVKNLAAMRARSITHKPSSENSNSTTENAPQTEEMKTEQALSSSPPSTTTPAPTSTDAPPIATQQENQPGRLSSYTDKGEADAASPEQSTETPPSSSAADPLVKQTSPPQESSEASLPSVVESDSKQPAIDLPKESEEAPPSKATEQRVDPPEKEMPPSSKEQPHEKHEEAPAEAKVDVAASETKEESAASGQETEKAAEAPNSSPPAKNSSEEAPKAGIPLVTTTETAETGKDGTEKK